MRRWLFEVQDWINRWRNARLRRKIDRLFPDFPPPGRGKAVFIFSKGTAAFVHGEKVYWDSSATRVTRTAEGNAVVGVADQDAAAEDDVIRVRIGE